MHEIVLPPGFHLYPGTCPACGLTLVTAGDVEGQPVWECRQGCGQKPAGPVCACGGPLKLVRDKLRCKRCGNWAAVCCEGGRCGP